MPNSNNLVPSLSLSLSLVYEFLISGNDKVSTLLLPSFCKSLAHFIAPVYIIFWLVQFNVSYLFLPIPGDAKAKAMPGRLYIHTRNNNNNKNKNK